MPKFAVYFVPEAESDFYRVGSSLLGYDVRTCQAARMSPRVKAQLPGFEEGWVEYARPYGFHLTIGDAIDVDLDTLPQIELELERVLGCFNPEHPFILNQCKKKPVGFFGQQVAVLRYDANDHLMMFHALVTTRINVLGTGSGYLDRYISNPGRWKPHQGLKIQRFFSPYVLDDYTPHFTVLNPYPGAEHERIKDVLSKEFAQFSKIPVTSICLLVQAHKAENWRIHREFHR
jgi:hypothetical protein